MGSELFAEIIEVSIQAVWSDIKNAAGRFNIFKVDMIPANGRPDFAVIWFQIIWF